MHFRLGQQAQRQLDVLGFELRGYDVVSRVNAELAHGACEDCVERIRQT